MIRRLVAACLIAGAAGAALAQQGPAVEPAALDAARVAFLTGLAADTSNTEIARRLGPPVVSTEARDAEGEPFRVGGRTVRLDRYDFAGGRLVVLAWGDGRRIGYATLREVGQLAVPLPATRPRRGLGEVTIATSVARCAERADIADARYQHYVAGLCRRADRGRPDTFFVFALGELDIPPAERAACPRGAFGEQKPSEICAPLARTPAFMALVLVDPRIDEEFGRMLTGAVLGHEYEDTFTLVRP